MPPRRRPAAAPHAFTLVEMLVATAVLGLLVVMVARIFNSALSVTSMNGKLMDADEQARVLFDRMSIDFARMVKRGDVDYSLKGPANPMTRSSSNPTGNDQIAFYSEVPGYYSNGNPAATAQTPVSLVGYRVNGNANVNTPDFGKLERLGKGLVWNGAGIAANGPLPLLFLPVPLASPLPSPLPSPMPAVAPTPAWPQAGNNDPDADYELVGPQIFRLEYYYLLKGQTVGSTAYPSVLSATPWNADIPGHLSVAGLQDVAAIAVTVAILDPQSHLLVRDDQLATFAAQLKDFAATGADNDKVAGTLESKWQSAVLAPPAGFPAAAARAVRVYHRYFYLNLPP